MISILVINSAGLSLILIGKYLSDQDNFDEPYLTFGNLLMGFGLGMMIFCLFSL